MTLKKILQTAKRFFKWLKTMYPQQYRHLPPAWIDALRLPRAARPVVEHEFVTLEQVLQLIGIPIPDEDIATWRDQAAAALLFLSGARQAKQANY
jgi:integrase